MSTSDAPKAADPADHEAPSEEIETEGAPADKPAGADQWAQAVVDGVPSDADGADTESPHNEGSDIENADTADLDNTDNTDDTDNTAGIDIDEMAAAAGSVDDLAAAAAAAGPIPESWFANGEANDEGGSAPADISVEDLVLDLERVTTERDQYLDASRRLQAEFENYKKQVGKREAEARERANDSLVGELLPVLDAFDGAMANGAEDVAPMRSSFLDALAKQGLERIDPGDDPFDPNLHEAVMHEDAADLDGPVVAEVMRAGYVWKGRVLRPAMVRTRG